MKNKIIALLLFIILLPSLSACNSNDTLQNNSFASTETTNQQKPVSTPETTSIETTQSIDETKVEYFSEFNKLPKLESIIDNVEYEQTIRGMLCYRVNVDSFSKAESLFKDYLSIITMEYGFTLEEMFGSGDFRHSSVGRFSPISVGRKSPMVQCW